VETSIRAVNLEAIQSAEFGALALWHLLSLDAPAVAALWTWFVARTLHVELPISVPIAMFLAVWLLYAADRLMDTMREDGELEARHRFHREHRFGFQVAMVLAGVALVPLMAAMPAALLHRYAALGVLLVGWFGLIHLLPMSATLRLPKELIPGPFFAAAVFLPCRLPAISLFFGLLCVQNCMYIYAWEHHGATRAAHGTTRLGVRMLTPLTLLCIVGPLTLLSFDREAAPIGIAIAGAAALLLGLDRVRGRVERTNLRAAADLVLLTPLLFAPFLR